MNWFTLSLIAGIIFVIIGIVILIFGETVAAIVCFAIGAGFLALDFNPATSMKSEFSGLTKEELVKKILGVIILVAALTLFIIEIQQHISIF
jgi:hypothetical protein